MFHQPIAAAEAPDRPARGRLSMRRFLLCLLGFWLVASAVMVALNAVGIAERRFPDVDDELRLVEVRDWLGGQAFRDVWQYRLNPPFGVPMHWSRLVDMPLAAIQLLARPMIGPLAAETLSAVVVPLLTFAIVMLCVALVARRLAGDAGGLLAAAMTPAAVGAMIQLQPLRVDHHGWEIAYAMIAVLALVRARGIADGVLAGAAIAFGLQVSLELLPFAVALGAIAAVQFIVAPDARARGTLGGYAAALAITETVLFAILHPSGDWSIGYCDAVSPPQLAALVVAGLGIAALVRFSPAARLGRIAGLAMVAAIAASTFHGLPPHCGVDTFPALEPSVRHFWLAQVDEGLPVWKVGGRIGYGMIGFPLIGVLCACAGWHRAEPERRGVWLRYLALLVVATFVGIWVMRAAALANALALPAAAWATIGPVRRAQASPAMLVRVFGSVAAILAFSPFAPAAAMSLLPSESLALVVKTRGLRPSATAGLARLDALPPARLLAPLDFGPGLLLETHHSVLASGHHRNHAAMAQELSAWLGSDAQAHRIVQARGIGYVLSSPAYAELRFYARAAPDSFAAHLRRRRPSAWLQRVAVPGFPLDVWRVLPQPPAGLPSSRSGGGVVPTSLQIARNAVLSPSS